MEIKDLKKVNLNPGDVVIITLNGEEDYSREMDIMRTADEVFPENKCIIKYNDMDIQVISPTIGQDKKD